VFCFWQKVRHFPCVNSLLPQSSSRKKLPTPRLEGAVKLCNELKRIVSKDL
jgi:hypothetical protein